MNDGPTPAGRADTPPEDELAGSIAETMHDLREVAGKLAAEPDDSARVLDRLGEELAQAAQMTRALPRRPAPMAGHEAQLLAALRTAHAQSEDVGETIARSLARLAAELGGSFEVLKNRPGGWEAGHVAGLLAGTVGPDDENLPMFGPLA